MPGPITSKQSWGPNLLIKDGAKLVQEANDVIEELPLEVRERLAVEGRSRAVARATAAVGASTHQAGLFEEQASSTGKKALAAASELELFGAIKQLPGKSFVLAWSS